jgi:hypothetical protein
MKQIHKGYTITVTSWENDADNYNTQSITVDTKEKAKVWHDMMQLCKSQNNQPKGVIKLGNSCGDFNNNQVEVITDFIRENYRVLVEPDAYDQIENATDDELVDYFCELATELLGSSEFYLLRVMESCVVTHSPIDVECEVITF